MLIVFCFAAVLFFSSYLAVFLCHLMIFWGGVLKISVLDSRKLKDKPQHDYATIFAQNHKIAVVNLFFFFNIQMFRLWIHSDKYFGKKTCPRSKYCFINLIYINWKIWIFCPVEGWSPSKGIMILRLYGILKRFYFGSKQLCI